MQPPQWAEVAVSVYELNGASVLNAVTETVGLGGAYHVGIEVYWLEWSYGRNDTGTGVHVVPVGQSTMGKFKERVSLGRTPLPPQEVFNLLARMRHEWLGRDYHFLRQNCGHFCMELAHRLRVPKQVPRWCVSLAEHGDWLTQWIGDPMESHSDEEIDEMAGEALLQMLRKDPIVAKNELEWYWAQAHTFERARDAAQQEFWGHPSTPAFSPPHWMPVPVGQQLL